jgi:pilus assembly protein Flp/PilA
MGMERLKTIVARFVRDDEGQDLIEYALLAALISVALVLILPGVATAITTTFNNVIDALT